MDSIKKVTIGEIKANKEELLNSMKGLVHTAKDIFGSTPFKDEYIAVGADHILTIDVGGNSYPVHYTPNTMAMIDGDLSVTDYIFDEENYLSLSDDDDMMWFSLVMQLDLKNKSNELSIEYLENEIERLKRERNDFKEALKEANKKCSDDTTEKPASEIIKECVGDKVDFAERLAEYAQKYDEVLNYNKILRQEITKLRVQLNSYSDATVVDNEDIQQTITKEAMAELRTKIEELETKLKDKDEYINQLSKNNATLSAENKNVSDLLKNADRDVRFYAREVDNLEKQIKDLQSKAILVAEKASDPDDIISRMETAYTKRTIELLGKITELENENEELKKKLFCELPTPTKVGEQESETPEDKAVKMDLETATLLQENYKLKEEIQSLKDSLRERISEYDRKLSVLKKQKEEAELIAYRFLRADYENRDKE